MELQSSGFSTEEIEAHANYLKRNVAANTARALREHFILERIAEEHDIDASDQDYDQEIAQIALQSNESPRRIRAGWKAGQMDTLRNQIIERKVIELVNSEAKFKEVPLDMPESDAAAVQHKICGGVEESEIPEAQGGEAGTCANRSIITKTCSVPGRRAYNLCGRSGYPCTAPRSTRSPSSLSQLLSFGGYANYG